MIKVGITGGIGSGKSTICRMFEVLDVPVYYADTRAKEIMVDDQELVALIKARFGSAVYNDRGELERQKLAAIVFDDEVALGDLNAMVHPAVFRDSEKWTEARQELPYTIKEAALLFESGSYKMLDEVITVFAPEELRIKRVMQRDGVSRETVMARIKRQWPDEKKLELADHVIYNDGSESIIARIWDLHQYFIQKSSKAV